MICLIGYLKRRLGLVVLCLGTLVLCGLMDLYWAPAYGSLNAQFLTAQAKTVEQWVDEGGELYSAGDYPGAIARWQTALQLAQDETPPLAQATILENLARVHRQIGHSYEAIAYWDQAIAVATALGDEPQQGRLLTEQAQTYTQLGQYRQALALLCGNEDTADCGEHTAIAIAQRVDDATGEVAALGSFGEALRRAGNDEGAIAALTQTLEQVRDLEQTHYEMATLQSLGNVYVSLAQQSDRQAESAQSAGDEQDVESLRATAQAHYQTARQQFEASQRLAQQQGDVAGELRAYLSLIPIYRQLPGLSPTPAATALPAAQRLLTQIPDSHEKVYATITLANLMQFEQAGDALLAQCFAGTAEPQAQALLTEAVEQARTLGDVRGEAFAAGSLGHWYECQHNYSQALTFTQQAQWLADQQRQGKDSLYLWQWQLGRILLAQERVTEAIQAYEQAVATLDELRQELLVSDRELQFDFRDTVDPIYRQLIALQLGSSALSATKSRWSPNEANLNAALTTVDSLRLAELQNYFGGDCEVIPFAEIQQGLIGPESRTAVLTSVLLGDRTAIIASFPEGDRDYAWIPVDDATLRQTLNDYRRNLERYFDATTAVDLSQSQQVYDWLIRPFADRLVAAQVETLVFVNDGILRSIPMAALHDGERYLVERYAIATIPTLSLTAASTLNTNQVRALVMGATQSLTVEDRVFRALDYVDDEVAAILNQMPNAHLLLDEDFNLQQLQTELTDQQYSVLHIATHGQFGTVPEDTFLVTGQGEKLTLPEMERLIRGMSDNAEAIELLALTACETAIGDERAALGLGGVAIRAGAKSAIASLWSINDQKTAELAADFYQGLVSGQLSKAKALQAAQIQLIEANEHPAFWAPFILVGNWL